MSKGLIIKALSGFYYVADSESKKIYECRARGKFRKSEFAPLCGDNVEFTVTDDDKGVVDSVFPRKNSLVRPAVANIDKLMIVAAAKSPSPNTFVIDKVIMNAENSEIEPILIFNKSDLSDDAQKYCEIYSNSGFKSICVSAKTGEGIDEILPLIDGCVCAFTGNSGVGKTSIINAIAPEYNLSTAEISEKLGRGRHTTRHIELYKVGGGYIIDTPGFSSFDNERCGFVRKENVALCFRDFLPYVDNCRFTGCSHTKEKGCAVIGAVNQGRIEKSRFESYLRLYEQSAAVPDWQIDKRN